LGDNFDKTKKNKRLTLQTKILLEKKKERKEMKNECNDI